ncbi:hypothetical protein FFLO_02167 [Filobasidium floriforme]|uniref:V-type proton ATPase subunit n=1 Tax=Filobasidium floriforme TaxID=5210 RepID=A0A8K0JNT8_9TREE|nr:ATPase, V0 complex, subunit E1/e2 [Filobasidium floriforme]KAG7562387.1 hypothetical protein FFLO_02167 [Filobasidium floriforme]KAH8088440.1 ATPase, V0 complex, subunit E1/e2 [Filobasidium floriforme]
MSGFLVFIMAIVALGAGLLGWNLTPKGMNQTMIRSSILLTLTCCYLMWAITYMAQLHPLMAPRRSDIRSGREAM